MAQGVVWPEAPALRGTTERIVAVPGSRTAGGAAGRRRPVHLAELAGFKGAFAANARGIQPISGIDGVLFDSAMPGLLGPHGAAALESRPWAVRLSCPRVSFGRFRCPTMPGLPRRSGDWATQETSFMVKIRLTRGGAKKRPFYHIIVTDQRSARDGRNIERLGFYNPVASGAEKRIELNIARVDHWVGQGAQMTDKVRNLYKEATKARGCRRQPDASGRACARPSLTWIRQRPPRSCWAGSHGAFGVRGEIKLESFTEPRNAIFRYQPWILRDAQGRERELQRRARARNRQGPGRDVPGRRRSRCGRSAARHRSLGAAFARCRRRNPASTTGSTSKACAWSTSRASISARVSHLFSTGANDVLVGAGRTRAHGPVRANRITSSRSISTRGLITVDWDPDF